VTIYETKDKVRKPLLPASVPGELFYPGNWKKPINNMDSSMETQTEIEIGNIKSLVFRELFF
jgi:hypothetical protein